MNKEILYNLFLLAEEFNREVDFLEVEDISVEVDLLVGGLLVELFCIFFLLLFKVLFVEVYNGDDF